MGGGGSLRTLIVRLTTESAAHSMTTPPRSWRHAHRRQSWFGVEKIDLDPVTEEAWIHRLKPEQASLLQQRDALLLRIRLLWLLFALPRPMTPAEGGCADRDLLRGEAPLYGSLYVRQMHELSTSGPYCSRIS